MKLSFAVNLLQKIIDEEGDMEAAIFVHQTGYDYYMEEDFKIDVVGVTDYSSKQKKFLGLLAGDLFKKDKNLGSPHLTVIE